MTSASDRFELSAEIVDKFSRPIRDFQHALSAINAPKSAQQIKKEFDAVQRSVARATEAVSGGLRRALNGLGLASISASMGLLAAFSAMKNFSSSVGEMRALSTETGYTVNTIRLLDAAANQFKVAPDTVRAGLKTFASNLYDFRRQFGSTYNEILKYAPDLAASLKSASPDQAVNVALDYLSRVEDRITAGRIAELLFGTTDFARFGQDGPQKLQAALLEIKRRIGDVSPEDDAKVKAFSEAVRKFNQSAEGLKKTLTIELAPALSDFAQWVDRFVRQNSKQIKDGLHLTFKAISSTAKAVNDVVERSVGWDLLIKGILLAKIGETAGGIVKFGAGFLFLGRSVSQANLTGLLAILSGLAAGGLAFGAFKAGASGGKTDASGPAKADGQSDAGSPSTPSPASSEKGQHARSEARLGSAVQDGVAKGIMRGLEAVSGIGASSSSSGGSSSFAGFGGSGRASIFDAARRGRMPAAQSMMQGKAVGGWWTPERRAYAIEYLMKHAGLSEHGAAGLVARWAAIEASGGPSSVNPKSGAEGVAQWLGSRKRPGYTDSGSLEKNLEHAVWELKNTEKSAASVLRKARTPWEGAVGASMYERAEGYQARTGVDFFTGRTPVENVMNDWKARKEKENGAAFRKAKEAGYVEGAEKAMPLFVRVHGAPRSTKISVDPGTGFSDAKVTRERGAE